MTTTESTFDARLIREAWEANSNPECLVKPTSIARDEYLSRQYDADVYLVSELQQTSGSYKIRGAYNRFRNRSEEEQARPVVVASAGNHSSASAECAQAHGTPIDIFMPESTPEFKRAKNGRYNPELVKVHYKGKTVDETLEHAQLFCEENESLFIHPFDEPYVVAGQGTLGLEIIGQLPNVNTIVAPVGGGGLLSGIVKAVRHYKPTHTHFVGVEPRGAASLSHALSTASVETGLQQAETIADGVKVKRVGRIALDTLYPLGDQLDVIKLSDKEITQEVNRLSRAGYPVEPAAALATASLKYVQHKVRGRTVACLLTGSTNGSSQSLDLRPDYPR